MVEIYKLFSSNYLEIYHCLEQDGACGKKLSVVFCKRNKTKKSLIIASVQSDQCHVIY